MIRYLTVEEVIAIHEYAVREFGGSAGVASIARLESAIAAPRQTMFGEDLYPDLLSKAAILVYGLIKNHPFVDGNKRTGLFALFEFLERNGFTIVASDDDLYQFAIDIATSRLGKEQIEAWLREHIEPYRE
ncbi:MAG: type II toxin-antitoxin system death-on-curing family toxin [Thermoflexales bacterium]|nr:type II toxin-antitoxin system death-on-curing family toxin [Thermoflexales bacterium]